jgi:hypothetical protein
VATTVVSFSNRHVAHDGGVVAESSRVDGTTDPTTPARYPRSSPSLNAQTARGKGLIPPSPLPLLPQSSVSTMSAIGGFGAGGARAPKKPGRGLPPGSGKKARAEAVATPYVPHRRGCPSGSKNKKKLAAAATVTTAGPSAAFAATIGPSWLPPALQLPVYSSVEGYVTFLVLVLAGGRDHLCLPSKFMEAMEG